jgi:hypothetical protein
MHSKKETMTKNSMSIAIKRELGLTAKDSIKLVNSILHILLKNMI